jgi:hypothetical protein
LSKDACPFLIAGASDGVRPHALGDPRGAMHNDI